MKKEVMANMDAALTWMPVAALLIFLVVFIGVLIWSFRKGSDEVYKDAENTVLDDGTKVNK
jgi:cbb3-type cytochrome oxidase subunit 3